MQGMSGKRFCIFFHFGKPDLSWAVPLRPQGGVAGRGIARLDANGSVCLKEWLSSCPKNNQRNLVWTSLKNIKYWNSIVNRGNTTNIGQTNHNLLMTGLLGIYLRFCCCLKAGREEVFVTGCWSVKRRLFCLCKTFIALHVPEQGLHIQNNVGSRGGRASLGFW